MFTRVAVALLACFASVASASDNRVNPTEIARFRAELRADEAVLSPALKSRLQSQLNQVERIAAGEGATSRLRALELDKAFSRNGLQGSVPTLLGQRGEWPNVYAPPYAWSSHAGSWPPPRPGE